MKRMSDRDRNEAANILEKLLNTDGISLLSQKELELAGTFLLDVRKIIPGSDRHCFNMPIGDWSGDGHELCDWYLCTAKKPIQEVIGAHYHIAEMTGVNIEAICSACHEDVIDQKTVNALSELGFFQALPNNLEYEITDGTVMADPDFMAHLWVFLLNKTDPGLQIEIPEFLWTNDDIPTLTFYGFDEQGRHIGGVGYGCYY